MFKLNGIFCENKKMEHVQLLHQSWKSTTLPHMQTLWRERCFSDFKGWEYKLWTDDDNEKLIKDFPLLFHVFKDYKNNKIKKIDAVRYLYLYKYGGIYMDIDFTCLKPLSRLPLRDGVALFGFQSENVKSIYDSKAWVANAFMAAPPFHPFVAFLISHLKDNPTDFVFRATGPAFLTRMLKLWNRSDVEILPTPVIYPGKTNLCGEGDNMTEIMLCSRASNMFLTTFTTSLWCRGCPGNFRNRLIKQKKTVPVHE